MDFYHKNMQTINGTQFLFIFCHSPITQKVNSLTRSSRCQSYWLGMLAVSPCQNRSGHSCSYMQLYNQCLLRISDGLNYPGRKKKLHTPAAMDSLTLWNNKALWRLWSLASIIIELFTTDLLFQNVKLLPLMGTPRYQSVFRRSIICSTHVRAAINSEP